MWSRKANVNGWAWTGVTVSANSVAMLRYATFQEKQSGGSEQTAKRRTAPRLPTPPPLGSKSCAAARLYALGPPSLAGLQLRAYRSFLNSWLVYTTPGAKKPNPSHLGAGHLDKKHLITNEESA